MEFQDSIVSKLILLYVLDKMEMPLTESSIVDICTNQNQWLNYMKCKDALFQLLESNFVYVTSVQDNEERYTISSEGRSCLDHFYNKIPFDLRNISFNVKDSKRQCELSNVWNQNCHIKSPNCHWCGEKMARKCTFDLWASLWKFDKFRWRVIWKIMKC